MPATASDAPPYVWFEAVDDPRVIAFLAEQSAITEQYLSSLPLRAHFRAKVGTLLEEPRLERVGRAGSGVFGLETGEGQVGALVRADSVEAFRRVRSIVYVEPDPHRTITDWSADNTARWIACVVSTRGSSMQDVVVVDASSGDVIDRIHQIAGTAVVWSSDGCSISFAAGSPETSARSIMRHEIGTTQLDDRVVYSLPEDAGSRFVRLLGGGDDWVLVGADTGPKTPNTILAIRGSDMERRQVTTLAQASQGAHRVVGIADGHAYIITGDGADRRRVVVVDLDSGRSDDLVPEHARDTLLGGVVVGEYLALKYTNGGSQSVDVVHRKTGVAHRVPLGTFDSISHLAGGQELVLTRSTITQAPKPIAVGIVNGEPVLPTDESTDVHDVCVERITAQSSDGTDVPVTIARPTSARGRGPLLLYAYGGFGVALRPGYSPLFAAWLSAGGSVAIGHVRGGGERGERWHKAATRSGRQRSFDDLYAVAGALIDQQFTTPSQMVFHGRSNGGLLAAVALTQRPDLWAAVLPAAGIYDMLRFDRLSLGRAWIEEFGDPQDPREAVALRAYSPLHNVSSSRRYPPTLVSVGTLDERVAASHAYKLVAALRDMGGCESVFLHIGQGGGHGFGASNDELRREYGDQLAFAAEHAGLELRYAPRVVRNH